jgi:hypothetical protein
MELALLITESSSFVVIFIDVSRVKSIALIPPPPVQLPCGEGCQSVKSKINGTTQIPETVFDYFPRPISSPLDNLRPARETCEKCHSPSKITGELLKTATNFGSDEANTPKSSTIVLKVGGGQPETGKGIHWHTTSKVWYLPLDSERLTIGWVGIEKDGKIEKEFIDPNEASYISQQRIDEGKRLMDCIDCHNRATHVFDSPAQRIDASMQSGKIDKSLPFIKKKSIEALDPPASSLDEAYRKVEGIKDFYKLNYPEFDSTQKNNIDKAVDELKNIARLTTFPDMNLDWNTHGDNSGHNKPSDSQLVGAGITFPDWVPNKSEGCFRCHGKLVR